mgnify:CR=1 FL=1
MTDDASFEKKLKTFTYAASHLFAEDFPCPSGHMSSIEMRATGSVPLERFCYSDLTEVRPNINNRWEQVFAEPLNWAARKKYAGTLFLWSEKLQHNMGLVYESARIPRDILRDVNYLGGLGIGIYPGTRAPNAYFAVVGAPSPEIVRDLVVVLSECPRPRTRRFLEHTFKLNFDRLAKEWKENDQRDLDILLQNLNAVRFR